MKYQKWLDGNITDLHGKTVLVTGANSGLGFSASKMLAYKGAHIIMACRSMQKAEEAKKKIVSEVPDASISLITYDQADFRKIDLFYEELREKHPLIDVMVCNAGIFHPSKKELINNTPVTTMTNFFGLYYLLRRAVPYLNECGEKKGQMTRVVMVTSLAGYNHKKIKLDSLLNNKACFFRQYKNSKKAVNILFHALNQGVNLYDFQDRKNISFHLVHPGVSNTNIIKGFNLSFRRLAHFVLNVFLPDADKASLSIVYAAGTRFIRNGSFHGPSGFFEIAGYPKALPYPRYVIGGSGQFMYEAGKYITELNK